MDRKTGETEPREAIVSGRKMVWIFLAILLSVTGCAGGTTTSSPGTPMPVASPSVPGTPMPAASPPAPPTGSPPPVTVAVYGSNACTIVDSSYSATVSREKFHCVETMSDPRVSGEWEAWITTNVSGTLGSWTGSLILANEGGTWRGTAEGTVSGIPQPTNYGKVLYFGEGGYAGLTYRVFLAGSNGTQLEAGWIEPAE